MTSVRSDDVSKDSNVTVIYNIRHMHTWVLASIHLNVEMQNISLENLGRFTALGLIQPFSKTT